MKKLTILLGLTAMLTLFSACEKKKKANVNNNIIVPPREVVVPDTSIHVVNEIDDTKEVPWVGSTYRIRSHRFTNDSLAVITDVNGHFYRNNLIKLTITRADGSVFFDRVFRKSMFVDMLGEEYARRSVLLGIVFDKSDANNLYFIGSVGCPDILTDDYVPFDVVISRMGEVSIKKAELEEGNKQSTLDDEGV